MKAFANGIAINYETRGPAAGLAAETEPPLVLIHALGLDSRQWRWQMPRFAERRRVICYDVRGHGQTDRAPGPYSIDLLAEDLFGLIAALGAERADVLGLSLGGMIAQELALAHPAIVRALVLADTTYEYSGEARRQFDERARGVELHGIGPLAGPTMERWFTPSFRERDPATVEEIRMIFLEADPAGYSATCRAIAGLDIGDRLAELRCPTLVLVGEDDPGTPPAMARRLHEAIAGSVYEVISEASHLSNVAQPERFGSEVLRFLDSLASPRQSQS